MLANDIKDVREMKKYIVTWRQERERLPGKPSEVRTFEDVFHAVNLPMAVGAWCGMCYANAEIVAVRLVETAQTGKGVAE